MRISVSTCFDQTAILHSFSPIHMSHFPCRFETSQYTPVPMSSWELVDICDYLLFWKDRLWSTEAYGIFQRFGLNKVSRSVVVLLQTKHAVPKKRTLFYGTSHPLKYGQNFSAISLYIPIKRWHIEGNPFVAYFYYDIIPVWHTNNEKAGHKLFLEKSFLNQSSTFSLTSCRYRMSGIFSLNSSIGSHYGEISKEANFACTLSRRRTHLVRVSSACSGG